MPARLLEEVSQRRHLFAYSEEMFITRVVTAQLTETLLVIDGVHDHVAVGVELLGAGQVGLLLHLDEGEPALLAVDVHGDGPEVGVLHLGAGRLLHVHVRVLRAHELVDDRGLAHLGGEECGGGCRPIPGLRVSPSGLGGLRKELDTGITQ